LIRALYAAIGIGVIGCAHVKEQKAEFFHWAHLAVPIMREYAIHNLGDLAEDDLRVLTTTEPKVGHANFAAVHFVWPNVCTVVAGPPPCRPQMVFDRRAR
jgi:hypothetical protein